MLATALEPLFYLFMPLVWNLREIHEVASSESLTCDNFGHENYESNSCTVLIEHKRKAETETYLPFCHVAKTKAES